MLRFNAERELDQNRGTWFPTSSGADPAQLMNIGLVGEPAAAGLDNTTEENQDVQPTSTSEVDSRYEPHLIDSLTHHCKS